MTMEALAWIWGRLPYLVSVWVLLWGLYGVVTTRNLIHATISLAVAQTSTYLLLLALGYRSQGTAPVAVDAPAGVPMVDPIVQALCLTDVVVECTVIALLLALAVQVHRRSGTLDPDQLTSIKG